jgi:hypothetical protein
MDLTNPQSLNRYAYVMIRWTSTIRSAWGTVRKVRPVDFRQTTILETPAMAAHPGTPLAAETCSVLVFSVVIAFFASVFRTMVFGLPM